jgi:hypothetical protein
MSNTRDARFSSTQLLWVGVIAFVAAVLTAWFRTESLAATLLMGGLSAAISVAIVWFVGWTRRAR